MPNPLIGALPLSTSRQATGPTPEPTAADNFPYRGSETHGVDPNAAPRQTPGYEEGRPVAYEAPLPEPEPVPVKIVGEYGRERRAGRTWRDYAKVEAASMVAGQEEGRRTLRVKNLHADTNVYIGHDQQQASVMNGWPLAPGEVYETNSEEPLWAQSAHATDTIQLALRAEYTVEL